MDDGDGLLYMRARYYAPALMRFLTPDPESGSISAPITLNRYTFARGSAVTFMDPFGRSATRIGEVGHAALDGLGFVPVAGAVFDLANGVWYAVDGDWTSAFLAVASAVPVVGDAAAGVKVGSKAIKVGSEALEGVAKTEKATKSADLVFGNNKKSASRLSGRMKRRLWTQDSVREVVDNPIKVGEAPNRINGGNSATAYFISDNQYVVVDDVTNEVIQVSNRGIRDGASMMI